MCVQWYIGVTLLSVHVEDEAVFLYTKGREIVLLSCGMLISFGRDCNQDFALKIDVEAGGYLSVKCKQCSV